MLLYSDQVYDKIHNDFILKMLIGKKYILHGTFASKKSKYMTDVDVINYYRINLDKKGEITTACKKEIKERISTLLNTLPENCYFKSLLAGFDDRFLIKGELDKKGKIEGFDMNSFKERIDKLFKSNVITDGEYKGINKLIKPVLTTSDYYLLSEHMLEFSQLVWTKDEIIKGEKNHRKKKFKFIDMMTDKFGEYIQNNPFLFEFVIRYDNMKYIGFDMNIVFYTSGKGVYNSNKTELVKNSNFKSDVKMINFIFGDGDLWIYIGIFKNLAQKKYLKAFKRLRTLLTHIVFDEKTPEFKKRGIHIIRKEMLDKLNESDFNKYNQIKNRIDNIIFLLEEKIVSAREVCGLTIAVIEDLWNHTEYNSDRTKLKAIFEQIKKGNITKLQLNSLKKSVTDRINTGAKKIFEDYYKRSQEYIPFRL